jgi:hypothetical protein
MDLNPALVLSMWTAGLAASGCAVAWWRIVGPGYTWLVAGVSAAMAGFAVAAGGGAGAWIGVVGAVVAAAAARRPTIAAVAFAVGATGLAASAWTDSPLALVLTGALFVGGVTSEMLLGHWYLVDPRLPRWALHRLAFVGGLGLVADASIVVGRLLTTGNMAESFFVWAYAALAVMTGLLIVGVWFSLKEPSYTGVMAATGLSYLAVLTALGTLVVGRLIAYG